MTNYIPMMFRDKNIIELIKTPNVIPLIRTTIMKWISKLFRTFESNSSFTKSVDNEDGISTSGDLKQLDEGQVIDVIDNTNAFGFNYSSKTLYKYSISKDIETIIKMLESILSIDCSSGEIIGVNSTYIYIHYKDSNNDDHILCIDKTDLSIIEDVIDNDNITFQSRNAFVNNTYFMIIISYNAGNEWWYSANHQVTGVKIRSYTSDLSLYIDFDPETFYNIGDGPFIYGFTEYGSGPDIGTFYPAKPYPIHPSLLEYSYGLLCNTKSKYNTVSGEIVINSILGDEYSGYDFSTNPLEVSRNISFIGNNNYIITFDNYLEFGSNINCYSGSNLTNIWTLNDITINSCSIDAQKYVIVTDPPGTIMSKESYSIKYIKDIKLYKPICIIDDVLICEERYIVFDLAVIPVKFYQGASFPYSEVDGTESWAYVSSSESRIVSIELSTGNITNRKTLTSYYVEKNYDISVTWDASSEITNYTERKYHRIYDLTDKYHSGIDDQVIFRGLEHSEDDIIYPEESRTSITQTTVNNDPDKLTDWYSIDLIGTNNWNSSTISTSCKTPIITDSKLNLFDYDYTSEISYINQYNISTGSFIGALQYSSLGDKRGVTLKCIGFNKAIWDSTYTRDAYYHQEV